VVRHDNDVRVHRRFGRSVLLWSVDFLTFAREAFSVTSRTKKNLFAGTLGVDPLHMDIGRLRVIHVEQSCGDYIFWCVYLNAEWTTIQK
jgi:hypothetical protein